MRRGFTLIELMITLAVVGVLATLAAPSFYDFILTQRLKATSQQLMTDLQFARSEAANRNEFVHVRFSNDAPGTCYAIFVGPNANSCNCANAISSFPGPICQPAAREIRTVQIPISSRVIVDAITFPRGFEYEPANGAMKTPAVDLTGAPAQQFEIDVSIVDTQQKLRTQVLRSGRPNICVPSGSTAQGTAC